MSHIPSNTPHYERDRQTRGGRTGRKAGSPGSESDRGHYSTNNTLASPYTYSESVMTQDTSLVFSPEQYRQASRGAIDTFAQQNGTGLADPFSTSARPGLNVNASAFQPTMDKGVSSVNKGEKFAASYLNNLIATSEHVPRNSLTRSGTFTKDSTTSRVVKVVCTAEGSGIPGIMNWLNLMTHRLQGNQSFNPISDKIVYIRHSHLTDAIAVHDFLTNAPELCEVSYFGTKALSDIFPHFSGKVTDYEGQVTVTVPYPSSAKTGIAKHEFEAKVRQLINDQGTVCAFETMPVPGDGKMLLVVEFNNAEKVPRAVQRLTGNNVDGETIHAEAHHPDVRVDPYAHLSSSGSGDLVDMMGSMSFGGNETAGYTNTLPNGYATRQAMVVYSQPGPNAASPFYGFAPASSGSGMIPYGQQLMMVAPMPMASYGMQPSGFAYELDDYYDHHHAPSYPYGRSRGGYGSRGNYASRRLGGSRRDEHKSENIVTIERIYNGSDVRTTIMVRNIPNKMNQMELKAFLDQTSRGKYDFMYLRIDFSNGANVGYAFVNYLDPMDIIEFIRARANRRWEDFHSDKVAEVSYATIQGRDCLIQKFRNSSVMLEPEECRPKLFYTEGHPLAGQEEPFPRSDNQSKLQRSCQNAEHVGLFAPAAGQHHRFEQRNRLSQFDRGTTMAAQEYEENFDGPFGNSYHGSYHRGGHRGGFSRGGGFARGGRGGRGGYLGWNGNDAHQY